ncbi:hypothetical protein [Salipiger marinus]|uniref:hypothetical protein n=1 Tax=Salipiger marinus TaxID=555512 RepID=UPI004059EB10
MKLALRPSPDFDDLAGWRARLAELQAEGPDLAGRASAIAHAETMIGLLETDQPEGPAERA